MQYRRLGKTDLMVSCIGFGGIPIMRVPRTQAVGAINRAIDLGVNFIETARGYRDSEEKIGEVMKTHPGRAGRDEVILASKAHAGVGDAIRKDLEKSLRTLHTEEIDLYQIWDVETQERSRGYSHWDDVRASSGALDTLKKARDEGLIRHIGISTHAPSSMMKEVIKCGEFETIQVVYNCINDHTFHRGEARPDGAIVREEIIPLAAEHDVGVIIMKPLAGGILSGPSEKLKFLQPARSGPARPGKKEIKTTAAGALRFVLANKGVAVALVGMTSVKEVEENVAVGEMAEKFTPEEEKLLLEEAARLGTGFCRGCRYCQSCPQGIRIPDIFRFYIYSTLYGLEEWAKEQYAALEVKVEACEECGECEEKCPYHLPTREKLKEAAEVLKG